MKVSILFLIICTFIFDAQAQCLAPNVDIYVKKLKETYMVSYAQDTISKVLDHPKNVELKNKVIALSKEYPQAENKADINASIDSLFETMVQNAEMSRMNRNKPHEGAFYFLRGASSDEEPARFNMTFRLNTDSDASKLLGEQFKEYNLESSLQELGVSVNMYHSLYPKERLEILLTHQGKSKSLDEVAAQLQLEFEKKCKESQANEESRSSKQ